MQSNSANRKLYLKNLADEYDQKHLTLQNVLDIKFATYNQDACVAFRDDYEPIVKVAMKLINDPNVKPKQKAKYSELVKKNERFPKHDQSNSSDKCTRSHCSLPKMGVKGEGVRF